MCIRDRLVADIMGAHKRIGTMGYRPVEEEGGFMDWLLGPGSAIGQLSQGISDLVSGFDYGGDDSGSYGPG